jgi:hypothetical protein
MMLVLLGKKKKKRGQTLRDGSHLSRLPVDGCLHATLGSNGSVSKLFKIWPASCFSFEEATSIIQKLI